MKLFNSKVAVNTWGLVAIGLGIYTAYTFYSEGGLLFAMIAGVPLVAAFRWLETLFSGLEFVPHYITSEEAEIRRAMSNEYFYLSELDTPLGLTRGLDTEGARRRGNKMRDQMRKKHQEGR